MMMLKHAVDDAFARMAKLYGRQFTSMFDGADDIEPIKAAWLNELQRLPMSLDRIAWALEHLPEKCPNAIQFRNLCQQAPNPQQLAMQASTDAVRGPTADELAKLRNLATSIRDESLFRRPSKQWAYDLIAKHERGEPVGSYPLKCALEVAAMRPGGAAETADTDPEDYLTP